MRIRTIKPEFYRHEGIAELPYETRILFVGLWGLCDSQGRFEWRPKRIKVEVFPYDTQRGNGEAMDVSPMLHELEQGKFLFRYEVEGKAYGQIPSFLKHQRLSGKEAQCSGRLPAPPDSIKNFPLPITPQPRRKQLGSDGEPQDQGIGIKEQGSRNKPKKTTRPTEKEFIDYLLEKLPLVNPDWTPDRIERAAKLKFETYTADEWHDGHGKEITIWKTKSLNSLKSHKPRDYGSDTTPKAKAGLPPNPLA